MAFKIEKLPKQKDSNSYDSEEMELPSRTNPHIPSLACHKISDIGILNQKYPLIDLNIIKNHFTNGGRLSKNQIKKIIHDSKEILKKEENVVRIDKKCFIIGDVHGQYYDLLSILSNFDLEKESLVFLGDYVDRGYFSTEVYLYLLLLKSYYPENVFLLRGNHESERMTAYFTFKTECINKYDLEIYDAFVESFKYLPLAAVVQDSAYCCHGGISPFMKYVSEINNINRFQEVQYEGLFCDILWSDPDPNYDTDNSDNWDRNDKRRCSFFYKFANAKAFLNNNNLKSIIRGHEVQYDGYRLYKQYNKNYSVITVFSAPNYCDVYKNMAAIIEYDNGLKSIKQIEAVDHPYVIPGFLDGINWSMPFVCEKVIEFAVELLKEVDRLKAIEESKNLKVSVAIMRAEREQIDEFNTEESTVDSCALNVSENEESDFGEIQNKDANNEKRKDRCDESSVSIEIAPSQRPEIITDLSKMKIDQALNSAEVKNVKNKETVVLNKDAKTNKKRGFFCFYGNE